MKPDLELSKSFYYSGMLKEADGDEDDECEDCDDMPMSSKELEQQIASAENELRSTIEKYEKRVGFQDFYRSA